MVASVATLRRRILPEALHREASSSRGLCFPERWELNPRLVLEATRACRSCHPSSGRSFLQGVPGRFSELGREDMPPWCGSEGGPRRQAWVPSHCVALSLLSLGLWSRGHPVFPPQVWGCSGPGCPPCVTSSLVRGKWEAQDGWEVGLVGCVCLETLPSLRPCRMTPRGCVMLRVCMWEGPALARGHGAVCLLVSTRSALMALVTEEWPALWPGDLVPGQSPTAAPVVRNGREVTEGEEAARGHGPGRVQRPGPPEPFGNWPFLFRAFL